MFTIGINAHLLSGRAGYRRAGIHHYISQLLAHLPLDAGLAYTVFTAPGEVVSPRPGLHVQPSRWPTEQRLLRIGWEQLVWPLAAARQRLDLLHSMAFVTPLWQPCPAVVTVYDLSFLHYPDSFPRLQRLYLSSQTRRSCRQARRVVAISASGRADVHRFFGVPLDQIDVVRPAVDGQYRPLPAGAVAEFRRRQGLPEQFVLHVGTLQPRKNIPVLLEAMAKLSRPGLPLVLVGGKGWLYDQIFARVAALGLQDQVHFAGYVPDESLPYWYNAATMLVFPSLYEGFGLPVVEAMACGTPVITANVSAMPEAAGDAALLFDPHDAAALAERMASVLGNSDLAATMRHRGLAQARQFDWSHSGRALAATYLAALK